MEIEQKTAWHKQVKKKGKVLIDIYPTKNKTYCHLDQETLVHQNSDELMKYCKLIYNSYEPQETDKPSLYEMIEYIYNKIKTEKG